MNTRKNSFFHSFSTSTSRFMKKGRLAWAGDLRPERFIFMIHNLQNSFICSAGGLRGFSLNFLTLKHLLLFLGITQQSTNLNLMMSERSHHHNPAAHSRSRPTHAKRGGPSLTHRPYPTANPAISIASVPRQRWVPNRGKQTAAPLSSKRGTAENGACSQCTQIAPSKTSRACSSPKQKTQRSCVSSGVK